MTDTTRRTTAELLEPRRLLSSVDTVDTVAAAAADAGLVTGGLDGHVVYLNAGHGFAWDADFSTGTWRTGRGENNEIVEDFGNQDQLRFAADHLLRAGATVVPLRPVGHQPIEVVLDNDDEEVTYSGAWAVSTNTRYFGDPGDAAYRFADAGPGRTAVATYRPDLPEAGHYPVYTWVLDSSNRVDQRYEIDHAGGTAVVSVDHRDVGKGWVYLGTYAFDAGTDGAVRIVAENAEAGVVIADAVRFGNGFGDISRGQGVSGQLREDEASLYWVESMVGQGASINSFRTSSDDESANVTTPTRYARHMNAAPLGDALYLSYHTNAGGGRGAIALLNTDNGAGGTPNQAFLARAMGDSLNDTLAALDADLEFAWNDRGPNVTFDAPTFDYGEISSSSTGNEFDATILEVGFHDDPTDAALLRDARVRDRAARATYEAAVRYFSTFSDAPAVFAPLAPSDLIVTRFDSPASVAGLMLRWAQPQATAGNASDVGYQADPVTSWIIEGSRDGEGFEVVREVAAGSSTTAASTVIPAGEAAGYVAWRVVAANAGGRSIPSRTAAGAYVPADQPRVLVVDGFDRLTRQQNPRQTTALNYRPGQNNGAFTVDRVRPKQSNSFDYAGDIARVAPNGVGLYHATPESFELRSLDGIDAVIWLAGEESSGTVTFTPAQRDRMEGYLAGGGAAFVSGSEVAWDLGALGRDAAFLRDTLRAEYFADDASTYAASGVAGGVFDGLSLTFADGSEPGGPYDVNFPDVLTPAAGGEAALTYATGGAAAVTYDGPDGGRVVTMGFGVETLGEADRAAVLGRVLDFLIETDDVAPVLLADNFDFERDFAVTLSFDEPIAAVSGLEVENLTDGNDYAATFDVSLDGGIVTALWSRATDGVLPDGNYVLRLTAEDAAGNPAFAAASFWWLEGDANRDRRVDGRDVQPIRLNLGNRGTYSTGDLNGDGRVDGRDVQPIRLNLGNRLPPPAPLTVPPPTGLANGLFAGGGDTPSNEDDQRHAFQRPTDDLRDA